MQLWYSIYGEAFALIIMHRTTFLANQTDAFSKSAPNRRERKKKHAHTLSFMLMITNMKI